MFFFIRVFIHIRIFSIFITLPHANNAGSAPILGWQDAPGWMAEPRIASWAANVATLDWTPPESVPAILEYDLELTPGSVVTTTSTSTTVNISTIVRARIRAKNANGYSAWSEVATIFPVDVLPAPASLSVTTNERSGRYSLEEFEESLDPKEFEEVILTWTPETSPNFKYYEVSLVNMIDTRIVLRKEVVVPTCTFPLKEWQQYRVEVRTCNANVCGDPKTEEVLGLSIPHAPFAPRRKPQETAFVLIWEMPAESARIKVDSYKIYMSDNLMSSQTEFTTTEREWTYTCTSADPFLIRISAINSIGESRLSPPSVFECGGWPQTPTAPTLVLERNYAVFSLPSGPEAWTLRWQLHDEFREEEIVITDSALTEYRWGPLPYWSHFRMRYAITNRVGTSNLSPQGFLHIAPVPDQIGIPRGRYRSDTVVLIEWQPITVTSWELEIQEEDTVTIVPLTHLVVSYEHTCTTGGAAIFRVRGVTSSGKGEWSGKLRWGCKAVVAAPNTPTLLETHREFIRFAWDIPFAYKDLMIGCIISVQEPVLSLGEFYESLLGEGQEVNEYWLDDPMETSFNHTTTGGQQYDFRVRLVTHVGDSGNSEMMTAFSGQTPRKIKRPITVVESTDRRIVISWGPDELTDYGGFPLLKWHIYVSTDGTQYSDQPMFIRSDTDTEFTIECDDLANLGGVDRAQQYLWIRIAATNKLGEGERSDARRWRCSPPADRPDRVTLLSMTYDEKTNWGKMTITWREPTLAELHGASILAYKIYSDGGDIKNNWQLYKSITDINQRTYTLSDTIIGEIYRFRMAVTTEVGDSELSDEEPFYMQIQPDPPSKPYVKLSNDANLDIEWDFSGSSGGSAITGFDFYVSKNGADWPEIPYQQITPPPNVCSITCNTVFLPEDFRKKIIWFRVVAKTDGFFSEPSEPNWARCSAVPEAPNIPVKTSATPTSAEFALSPSDDMHGAPLVGYQFAYRDKDEMSVDTVLDVHHSRTHVNVTGLRTGRLYEGKQVVISDVGPNLPVGYSITWLQGGYPDMPDPPECDWSDGSNLRIRFVPFTKSLGGVSVQPMYQVFVSTNDLYWGDVTQPVATKDVLSADPTATFSCSGISDNDPDAPTSSNLSKDWVWIRIAIWDTRVKNLSPSSVPIKCFCGQLPASLSITEANADMEQISVEWEEPTLKFAPFVAYHLSVDNGLGGRRELVYSITRIEQRTASIPVPYPARKYTVEIQVESAAGRNNPNYIDIWACEPPAVLPPPVLTRTVDKTIIVAHWSFDPDTDLGGCILKGFRVHADVDNDGTFTGPLDKQGCEGEDQETNPYITSCEIKGLPAGAPTTIGVSVQLFTHKKGTFSERATTTLNGGGLPLAFDAAWISQTSGTAGNVGQSSPVSIQFSWQFPTSPDPSITSEEYFFNGGAPRGFAVYRDDGDGSFFPEHGLADATVRAKEDASCTDALCASVPLARAAGARHCTITGLQYHKIYQFQMAMINEWGEGARSDIFSFETGSVPLMVGAPVHVSSDISDISNPSITFQWQLPADNGHFVFNYVGELKKRDDISLTHDPLLAPELTVVQWLPAKTREDPYRATEVTLTQASLTLPPPTTPPSTSTPFQLTIGELYQFRLKAENAKGFGDWSSWSSLEYPPPRGWLLSSCAKVTSFQRKTNEPYVAGFIPLEWAPIDSNERAGGQAYKTPELVYHVYGRKFKDGAYVTEEFEKMDEVGGWENRDGLLLPEEYEYQRATNVMLSVEAATRWDLKVQCFSTRTGLGGPFSDPITVLAAALPGPVRNLTILPEDEGLLAQWLLPEDWGYMLILDCEVTVVTNGATTTHTILNTQLFFDIENANAATVSVSCRTDFGTGQATSVTYP